MRILFAGTPQPALPSLQRLIDSPHHEVVAVLTRPDAAAGRRGTSVPSPVGQLAIDAGIPLLRTARPNTGEFAAHLREFAPECCAVVAYGALLGPDLLAVPPHGWVNLHFSLLPAWRGAAPVQAAIAGGDTVTGATTFRLDAGLDTGPVYGVLTETIRPRDTAGELLDRLAVAGAGLLTATLDGIADGALSPVPQPAEGASLAPKITVEQARVRWDLPAHVVERRIRSVTPAPGAWTMIENLRVKVGPVTVDDAAEQSGPERSGPEQSGPERLGPGVFRIERSGVRVGTATQPVLLGQVQPPGKKAMAALDWVRGARFGDQVVAL
jgi:methionyl-tRNA formyltransferase